MLTAEFSSKVFIALGGGLFLLGGACFRMMVSRFVRRSVAVDLEVVASDTRPDGENERLHYPTFRILSGQSTGSMHRSVVGYSPAIHRVGDRTSGYLDPHASEARSSRQVRAHSAVADVMMVLGLTLALAGLFAGAELGPGMLAMLVAVWFASIIRAILAWYS